MHSRNIRRRSRVAISIVAVVALGLASRKFPELFPACLGKYPGDALWALMVFLGVALINPTSSPARLGLLALLLSYLDEFSQIYHAPWIDSIRHTTAGHLLLGSAFSWLDLAAYTVGIGLGVGIDVWLARGAKNHFSTAWKSLLAVEKQAKAKKFLRKAKDGGPRGT